MTAIQQISRASITLVLVFAGALGIITGLVALEPYVQEYIPIHEWVK